MGTLYLSELNLSHFRSHKHARMFCDGRPVAIYGANGAGKTNILEAVSLFSPGRGLRGAGAEAMTRRPEALGWKVSGIVNSRGQVHEIDFASEGGQSRQVRIDDKTAPQTALGRIARVLWLVPAMDRLWTEAPEGRRRFLDRMTLSFFPSHAEATLTYEKAMRDRNRLLKDQVRDISWFEALEAQMATAGAEIIRHRSAGLERVIAAQNAAETSFPAASLSLTHPEGDLPETEAGLKATLAEGRMRDMGAGRTLVGPHRVDLAASYAAKGIAARDSSTGEQKALLVSLILSNARALAEDFGAPPLLLLDEVAAHLDAGRRAALYDEICALGAQAWMTGTGPELFEDLGDRAERIEVRDNEGISEVTQLPAKEA